MKSLWPAIIVAMAIIVACKVNADSPPREFSIGCPNTCEEKFQFPNPTDATQVILDNFARSQSPPLKPRDRIQICNSTYCIIYTKNENAWRAEEEPIKILPGGNNTGGSGGGGGGSLPGGVSGVVIIGPPISVRPN